MEPGLQRQYEMTVTEKDTAQTVGSGDLAVFATPALAALIEKTAVRTIEGKLCAEETTVGASLDLQHLAPTPVGETVSCTCTLSAVKGRKLLFQAEVFDEHGKIAQCSHTRVVVDRRRFLDKLEKAR